MKQTLNIQEARTYFRDTQGPKCNVAMEQLTKELIILPVLMSETALKPETAEKEEVEDSSNDSVMESDSAEEAEQG